MTMKQWQFVSEIQKMSLIDTKTENKNKPQKVYINQTTEMIND